MADGTASGVLCDRILKLPKILNHFLSYHLSFFYFMYELQIVAFRLQYFNCKRSFHLPVIILWPSRGKMHEALLRVVGALNSSVVLVAIKSMGSKIWTGAKNSKEGKVSWTAWQQLQAWACVLFWYGIVRIRCLVFKVHTTGRGSTGRGEKTTAAPCKILYHSLRLHDGPLWGKYDSAVMKHSWALVVYIAWLDDV